MNLINAQMHVYITTFDVADRMERARFSHSNPSILRTRRIRRPRHVMRRSYA